MHSRLLNCWIKACILLTFFLNSPTSLYSQESQPNRELDEAIDNAKNAHYELAIPVLKKYAEIKGFNDFKTLEINIYLNLCYLGIKNKALDVVKANALTDIYFEKYGISKTDTSRSADELTSLYYVSLINKNAGEMDKMILYLSLIIKNYQENHLKADQTYCQTLVLTAYGYYNLQNYKSAIEVAQKAWKVNLDLFGEKSEASLQILDLLYSSFKSNNELEQSINYLQKYVEIGKEVFGGEDIKYINSLYNLALDYSDLGYYKKSLEIELEVVELRKGVLGEKHPDYLSSLNNLALSYSNNGEDHKALEICLQVVELRKEVLGEKHPDYIFSLNLLASIYSDLGNYKKALEINLIVVDLAREVLGEKDPGYLMSLADLSSIYSKLGNYLKALDINLKVVDLEKKYLGEKHPDYLTDLTRLASVYRKIGDYKQALEIDLEVVEVRKEVLGEKHPDYYTTLVSLASDYLNLGDFIMALKIELQAVDIGKYILGEKHPGYITSLSTLAKVYSALGDYQQALKIELRAVELSKQILGEKHPDYITSLSILASVYTNLGDYNKALEITLNIVELRKESVGEKHPFYLGSLSSLASRYSNLGNFQKAIEINLKIVEIEKEVFGEKHPQYLTTLGNLAVGYSKLGENAVALELFQKVAELYNEVLGNHHPDYLISLNNLAIDEFKLSQFDSALYHKQIVTREIQCMIVENFSSLTENQRELFFKRYRALLMFSTLFVDNSHLDNPESACFLFDFILFSKGLLLNTTLDFDKLIAEKGTPEAIAKFEELKLLRLEIQRLLEKPIAERYLNVDSLENITQQKEIELVKISKEYGDYTSNLKVNWKDVQLNLQDKDVAIEFVEYPTLTDTVKYAALVLRKGWQYPKFIPLFREDEIEGFIKQDKNRIYSNDDHIGKQLKKLIWTPLETVVSPADRVYFSPAGIIHLLAIENLPVDDSTTLGDRYQMYRLSSTKELVISQKHATSNTAFLYGGLIYSLDMPEMEAESKKYEFEKSNNYLAMRGYQNDTKDRNGWKFLNGTKPEVDQISRMMKEKDYQVSEFTGKNGNEESFKSLSGKKENIIHIATHGFFESIEESRKNPFILQRIGDQQQERATVDPMLRSGLIMAGGNKAWLGEKIPENIEDGVLTAKEISRMDLRGTDLVVLSACETGLGEVSSEGVFGLQRSFKQAGVHTLVMSLWEVNDKATMFIMTEFYSNLLTGKDKRAAFLEAKRKCRKAFPEPQNWAAFIMLD